MPAVEKLVSGPLAHARKKSKKAKLWKLKLNDTGMTGGQVKCLAEALVSHPIVASLDLRNNMVGDKGAVALHVREQRAHGARHLCAIKAASRARLLCRG